MVLSDLIEELRGRLALYGDSEVTFRYDDMDFDVLQVYHDEDAERVIISGNLRKGV